MIYKNEKPAILMFQDGTYYEGIGFGAVKKISGEITISTVPGSGYVEILTDPTYKDQIVLFTNPSIGNFGVKDKSKDEYGILKHFESDAIKIKGLIVNEYCEEPSHYESVRTLEDWLIEENIPGIQWIDTRVMTQEFVINGSKLGLIQVFEKGQKPDLEELKAEAKSISNPVNTNLVEKVSINNVKKFTPENPIGSVIILDLGAKNNLLRILLSKSIEVVVVPYNYSYNKIKEMKPNGVLIPNGPGNPNLYKETIETIKNLITDDVPSMGVGLGNMLIGLANGYECYKMTAEHRGGRTTVESATNLCFITFQNHAYCLKDVKENGFKQYFHDKDDNTNEGLIHQNKPIFSVAFNPEGSPGPLDMKELIFNKFIKLMEV